MSLIRGMGGLFKRNNPFRAFGDAVYLSDYWSREAPSRHEIAELLVRMRKLGVYQLNYEGGVLADDGSIKFPTNAEPFTWEADAWCAREKYPMKFIAWVRNYGRGRKVSLATPGIQRNIVYCLNFFCMFRGLLLDFDFDTPDEQKAFLEILRTTRRTYPDISISVRARNAWLNHPELVKSVLEVVSDFEVPLFNSSLGGDAYRLWCAEETARAMRVVGSKHLVLSVPATHDYDAAHRRDETLEHALGAVRGTMQKHTPHRLRLALFREGGATEEDWKVFAREWAH